VIQEVARQPVEQFRMRGRLALAAEILRRGNKPTTEEELPEAVDRDAGRQRIAVVGEPAGQPEAIARVLCRGKIFAGVSGPTFSRRASCPGQHVVGRGSGSSCNTMICRTQEISSFPPSKFQSSSRVA
jgi:hypothetical protein